MLNICAHCNNMVYGSRAKLLQGDISKPCTLQQHSISGTEDELVGQRHSEQDTQSRVPVAKCQGQSLQIMIVM